MQSAETAAKTVLKALSVGKTAAKSRDLVLDRID